MRALKMTIGIAFTCVAVFATTSCKNNKKEKDGSAMESQNSKEMTSTADSNFPPVIKNYLALKEALANDDNESAKKAGKMLMASVEEFDASKYPKKKANVNDILADAKEMSEHISESPLHHQREHFKILSKDMEDLVAITGTPDTLYQEFCPMYDSGKGGSWLSTSKDIKNPYYGKKMQKCGEVQKTINP